MDIMDLCLRSCCYIIFKSRFESFIKALLSEVVSANYKISEPIKHIEYLIEYYYPNVGYERIFTSVILSFVLNLFFPVINEKSQNDS